VRRTHVSCGVDIGSTNIKVVAVRADGTVVARHSRPTPGSATTSRLTRRKC
jgi:predicted NBD/HSP70 family sugar kinase